MFNKKERISFFDANIDKINKENDIILEIDGL